MTDYVVWLDSEVAQIFQLKTDGVQKSQLKKNTVSHHTQNKKDQHTDNNLEHFFRDLALRLSNADQLLILGPSLTKQHFKTHLETHHTGDQAKKIVGIENSDHPTEAQILAAAHKFFKKHDLYNNPI